MIFLFGNQFPFVVPLHPFFTLVIRKKGDQAEDETAKNYQVDYKSRKPVTR